MEYNLVEKLAIIKAIDEVLLADGHIRESEVDFLEELMRLLKFDYTLIREAREITAIEAMAILKVMTGKKKNGMAVLLREMAHSDGDFNNKEYDLILNLLLEAGVDPQN
jgi:uncharacterized tellurite resistance protein B-like protein